MHVRATQADRLALAGHCLDIWITGGKIAPAVDDGTNFKKQDSYRHGRLPHAEPGLAAGSIRRIPHERRPPNDS